LRKVKDKIAQCFPRIRRFRASSSRIQQIFASYFYVPISSFLFLLQIFIVFPPIFSPFFSPKCAIKFVCAKTLLPSHLWVWLRGRRGILVCPLVGHKRGNGFGLVVVVHSCCGHCLRVGGLTICGRRLGLGCHTKRSKKGTQNEWLKCFGRLNENSTQFWVKSKINAYFWVINLIA
jgi:hypothetical protein